MGFTEIDITGSGINIVYKEIGFLSFLINVVPDAQSIPKIAKISPALASLISYILSACILTILETFTFLLS